MIGDLEKLIFKSHDNAQKLVYLKKVHFFLLWLYLFFKIVIESNVLCFNWENLILNSIEIFNYSSTDKFNRE